MTIAVPSAGAQQAAAPAGRVCDRPNDGLAARRDLPAAACHRWSRTTTAGAAACCAPADGTAIVIKSGQRSRNTAWNVTPMVASLGIL